jgi:hypothetical protein
LEANQIRVAVIVGITEKKPKKNTKIEIENEKKQYIKNVFRGYVPISLAPSKLFGQFFVVAYILEHRAAFVVVFWYR